MAKNIAGLRVRITVEFTNETVTGDKAYTTEELDEFLTDLISDENPMGRNLSAKYEIFEDGIWQTA